MSNTENNTAFGKQLWHLFMHLRLHYQFFILSGGFLLGGLFVEQINWSVYLTQFLNIHVLLFGGATAYNSYWDKDEGPIGGLKNPPKMTKWMWAVSFLMQYVGAIIAFTVSLNYFIIYVISFVLFWLYSTPHARWKGHPILSLVAIGISTGTNSFLLGLSAAGGDAMHSIPLITAMGVAFILLSLYPVSQVFQIEEDLKRGDRTFASVFGLSGVRNFYVFSFSIGAALITYTLTEFHFYPGLAFGVTSILSLIVIFNYINSLKGEQEEYPTVMKIKFLASFGFVLFIISSIVIKNELLGIESLESLF